MSNWDSPLICNLGHPVRADGSHIAPRFGDPTWVPPIPFSGQRVRRDRDHDDARAMLAAAYVLGRRADEQGKRTFVTQVLIKVLQKAAAKWSA